MQLLLLVAVAISSRARADDLAPPVPPTPSTAGAESDLDYFFTPRIPMEGHDAPAISNHWLWAQVANEHGRGILDMEDIRCGGQPPFQGTTLVRVNDEEITLDQLQADWWPNKVRRETVRAGIRLVGTVTAAREKYALLSRLSLTNTTAAPRTVRLELRFVRNDGHHGTVESPEGRAEDAQNLAFQFAPLTLNPGQSCQLRAVHLYRSDAAELGRMLAAFEREWQASDDYWRELLADAFTPGEGSFLSGGMPRFHTQEKDAQRFYYFGVVTALMMLKRDPDCFNQSNLYVTSMPDDDYGTTCYFWDVGYASEILALLDPAALRTTLEQWARLGPYAMLSFSYDTGQAFLPGRFYAANGSMFFLAAWNYLNFTGDYAWLDKKIGDRTMLEHLRQVADWPKTRPQWHGLTHYGEDANIFDDDVVPGYHHFVAAPNAAAVWTKRRLADIYEKHAHNPAAARELRAQAQALAEALIRHLYNPQEPYAGTFRQRHLDGTLVNVRHSWDFMNAGAFLAQDLSSQQKQQMRDWYMAHCVRPGTEDRWVVAQDPRDGNFGPNQMEHSGRGAYPAWPFHHGWALHAMGFHQEAVDVLRVIDGITVMGAIGQGHHPDGRRCRPNWISVAGSTAAAYILRNIFDVAPGLSEFHPRPQWGDFDPTARLENLCVQGRLYRVTAEGAQEQ